MERLRRRLPLAEMAMFLYMGANRMSWPAGNELVQDMVATGWWDRC